MTYNVTPLNNVNKVSDLMIFSNNIVDGLLAITFILAIFFVLLFQLRRWPFHNSLLVSGFVTFILSLFLTYMGALHWLFPCAFLTITAFTAFYCYTVQS